MNWSSMLPLFILLTAFVTGMVLLVIPESKQKLRTTINLVNAFLTIIMIVVLIIGINSGQDFRLVFPLLPNINLVLHADPLSLMFVGLSGVLWFVTTIYAIGYLRNAKHQSRFFGFFSLCVFATLGIAMAGNLITFLIFYELLTLAAYPLIVHKGNEASLRAGRIYLRYTMIGGAVLLVAVAVVKAGAFGIIRVIYDVYGFEFADSLGVLFYLSIAASITIVYASIRALYQDDLKKRLAYSTVSQVSYIALGASIGGPLAAIAAVTHLVHQGIMKITMFFSAGNFAEALHIHKVSELDGVGSRMPLTMTALTMAIFGMIGIPPIAGFVTKWYLGNGAIAQGQYWVLVVLALSSLLNAMYLLPIVYRGWFKPSQGHWPAKSETSKLEVYWMLLIPPLITVTLSVLVGLFAASEFSPLKWAKVIASQEFVNLYSLINIYPESSSLVPWFIVLAPMLCAGVLFFSKHKRLFSACAPICALPAIYFAFAGIDYASSSSFLFFSNQLLLNQTTQLFLMLAGVLWFLATLYAQFYMAKDPKQSIFTIFMLLAMSGCFGLTLSQDPYGFITFFTLMSLSSFVLVIHHGLAKSALFFSVGISPLLTLKSLIRYVAYLVIIMPALALVGMPLLSGGFAKLQLKEQLISMPLLPTLISISSLFTGLLMYRFIHLMSQNAGHHYTPQKHIPLLLICLLTVLFMILWPLVSIEALRLSLDNIFVASWPIVVAIFMGLLLNKHLENYAQRLSNLDHKRPSFLDVSATYFSSLFMSLSRILAAIAQRTQYIDSKFITLTLNRISIINAAHLSVVFLTVLSLVFIALMFA